MIEKTIDISGQQVKFRSSATIPRLYRIKFKRDIFKDLTKLEKAYSKREKEGDEELEIDDLEIFENVAYIMAYHADPTIPKTIDEWLDQFEMFSIYQVLPEILELWGSNMMTDIEGRMPKNKKEIVVDKLALERMQKEGSAKQAGFNSIKMFLGKNVELDAVNEFIIVGITNENEPCIYTDPSLFLTIVAKSMDSDQAEMLNSGEMAEEGGVDDMAAEDYSDEDVEGDEESVLVDYNDYNFKGGKKPVKDYEAVVSDQNKDEMKLGKKIDRKVNGHKLKVVGYYHEGDEDYQQLMLVNSKTLMYSVIEKKSGFVVYGKEKASIKEAFEEEGLKVEDPYSKAKNKYVKSKEKKMTSQIITALIILLISLIEIFLIMRASFLSRIKEVGVYRAIGVKRFDIYKMFIGEIIAITVIAGMPGYVFACYLLHKLTGNSILAGEYMLTPMIMITGLVIIFAFNLIFGLLPVARTLMQVPARILARNDVN